MTNPFPTDIALARFREGYNCSQSVLCAFAEEHGLPLDLAVRLAAPFGGGIGRQGEVCGAATGGLLALGLRYASSTPDGKSRERTYELAADFMRRFEERFGAIHCRDLIQQDLSTPEGLAAARERKVFRTLCPNFVAAAVEIVAEMMLAEAAHSHLE